MQDSWYYHLCVAQSGEDLKLTKTEKLISELMYEKSATNLNQNHWKHSVLNYATKHLLHSLTSLPSASLNIEARKLFQSLKLFMTNKITLDDITYHIHSTQHIISTCFKHPPLQDEFYCQILKQISGHTYPIPYQVFQVSVCNIISVHTCRSVYMCSQRSEVATNNIIGSSQIT